MSNNSPIILYDIPSRDPRHCWSWNTWKTRFLLNFKGLDYLTEWVEYPDIRPMLEKHLPGEKYFSVPTIRLEDGETYIRNSRKIVDRIEIDHPTPSVHLDSPYLTRLEEYLDSTIDALDPIYMYLVPTRVLSDNSIPYFLASREKEVGMPLVDFHNQGKEVAWEACEDPLSKITTMLQETDGPFFMGQTVSYTDFVYGGFLLFLQGLGDDVFAKFLEASRDEGNSIKALLEALKPWSERHTH